MSIPWLVIVYLSALQIHGFDIDRKLWKDKAKSDEAETELTDFGSNMGGRSIPLLSDKLSDLDNSIESRLTKDTPDFARRGLPLFEEDELQNQNDAIEPYLTKETPEFVDRGLSPLEDEQQNLDDAVEAYEPKDDPGLTERGLPLFEDAYDAVEAYMDKDISDPVERGLPLFDDEQQGLEELNGDDPDMDKRNSLTIFDMFNDIANRLDDIQGQIDELREGKKLENCPDGWYRYGKSCYFFSRHPLDWLDAKTFCEGFHGYLAEINDYSENAYIWGKVKSFKAHFWVGGTDLIKENHWQWAHSQTPLTTSEFLGWGNVGPQPDNAGGNEHCMDLRLHLEEMLNGQKVPKYVNPVTYPDSTPSGGSLTELFLPWKLTTLLESAEGEIYTAEHDRRKGTSPHLLS